ncbi:MAG: (deoxy)nucleoside triphosphate pyrophosphohydrolase [Thermodesulfobacteriota bacterium]|nr:(deoxy)nucleoside triphosphate pyrophosphohydrolase [Thermodesulfobacteriota bacterium]
MITVTAGVLFRETRVFIARRKSAGRLAGKWEFPGGKVEDGETAEESLKRELKEELEIEAVVGDCLGESIHRYDFGTVKVLFFHVHWAGGEIHSRDHDQYRWVPLDELHRYDFVPADWPFVRRLMNRDCGPSPR